MRRLFADLWLLLGLQRQVGWNGFRARKTWSKVSIVLGSLWVAISVGSASAAIGWGVGRGMRFLGTPGLESLPPTLLLAAVTLLVLFSSFGVALGSLFLSSDLETLMSAPVDRRAVFAAKVLDGLGLYYALVGVVAGPALVGYGLGLRYGVLYFPLALVALLGTPLPPAGLGALLVLIVARFAPARRVREVLGFAAALVGVGCSLIGQTSRVWTNRLGGGGGPEATLIQLRALEALPLPPMLAGRGLAAAGRGDWGRALLEGGGSLLLTFALFAGCILLAERLYATGWVRMQSSGVARRRPERRGRAGMADGWLGRAPDWAALALKDWRVIPRDLRSFAQILSSLLILPVIYFNLVFGAGGRRRGGNIVDLFDRWDVGGLDPAGVVIAAGILTTTTMLCSRVALTSISMEGRSWWLLKAAPLSPMAILRGKFAGVMVPFAIISTMLLAGAALWRGFGPLGTLYGWFGIEILGAGSLALAVGLSVPWAKLDWDDPRKMGSGWGGLLWTLGATLFGLVAGGLLCLPLLAAIFRPALLVPAWVAGILGPLAVTTVVGWAAFRLGARFLPRVGEA